MPWTNTVSDSTISREDANPESRFGYGGSVYTMSRCGSVSFHLIDRMVVSEAPNLTHNPDARFLGMRTSLVPTQISLEQGRASWPRSSAAHA